VGAVCRGKWQTRPRANTGPPPPAAAQMNRPGQCDNLLISATHADAVWYKALIRTYSAIYCTCVFLAFVAYLELAPSLLFAHYVRSECFFTIACLRFAGVGDFPEFRRCSRFMGTRWRGTMSQTRQNFLSRVMRRSCQNNRPLCFPFVLLVGGRHHRVQALQRR